MPNEPMTTIVGNLTRDPELKVTPNGHAVASFTIATTPRVPDGDGRWKDGETWFVRCSAWNALAENVCDSLSKGAEVVASGRLRAQTWETDAGEKRNAVEMAVDNMGPSLRHAKAKVVKVTREHAPTSRAAAADAGTATAAGPSAAADGWPEAPPL